MITCSPSVSTHVSVIWGEPSGINVVMKQGLGLRIRSRKPSGSFMSFLARLPERPWFPPLTPGASPGQEAAIPNGTQKMTRRGRGCTITSRRSDSSLAPRRTRRGKTVGDDFQVGDEVRKRDLSLRFVRDAKHGRGMGARKD